MENAKNVSADSGSLDRLVRLLKRAGATDVNADQDTISFVLFGERIFIGCYGGMGYNEGLAWLSVSIEPA